MDNDVRIADDFRPGIRQVVVEIYGTDTPRNRRRVYRQLELPPGRRLKGIFKTGEREVSCVPSVVRADLARRAGIVPEEPAAAPPQEYSSVP